MFLIKIDKFQRLKFKINYYIKLNKNYLRANRKKKAKL